MEAGSDDDHAFAKIPHLMSGSAANHSRVQHDGGDQWCMLV